MIWIGARSAQILRRFPFIIITAAILAGSDGFSSSFRMHDMIGTGNSRTEKEQFVFEINTIDAASSIPNFTLFGWANGAGLTVSLGADRSGSFSGMHRFLIEGKDGVWIKNSRFDEEESSGVIHQFYPRAGGFEWEIVIDHRPDSDSLIFPIRTSGLEFLYQPKLTAEEEAAGVERPDSVVGSYAVYLAGSGGDRIVISGCDTVGERHGTGKVFHIYRPRAHDSRGRQVWCDLKIDTALAIVVPSEFLESADYPVTIDPTFGNTAVGASTAYLSNTVCQALSGSSSYRHSAGAGEIITSYSLYCLTYSNPAYVSLASYSYADGYPQSRLAPGVQMTITNGGMQWNTSTAVSQSPVSGTTYVIAFGDVSPASSIRARFDSESNVVSVHNAASLPSAWSQSSTAAYRWSLYATYTIGTSSFSPRRRIIIGRQRADMAGKDRDWGRGGRANLPAGGYSRAND